MSFRTLFKNYALAFVAVGVAFFFYLMIGYLTGQRLPPYITFYPAVIIVALAGGVGPGLVATMVAALVVDYFILLPRWNFKVENAADVIGLILFCGMGILMSVVAHLYRRLRSKLEETVANRTAELKRSNEQLKKEIEIREQSQESLRKLNEELEQRIAEQISEIRRANETLEVRIAARTRELQTANATLRTSRLAALNLMEDTVEARRQAEQAQERLDLALRAASMGVWRWEIIEEKRYFDDQTCHLLGIDAKTFTGAAEEFFRVVHPEYRDKLKMAMARTVEQNAPYESEYEVTWPDGSIHYITARGRLTRDDAGRPVRINGIIWDITERKKAEQALAERARLLDLSYDAIMVRDARDRIIYWNKSAETIYGYTKEEALGRSPHELLRTEFPQSLEKILDSLKLDGRWTSELLHTCKDGRKITVITRWAVDRDSHGDIAAILETNSDITERKKAEEALRESGERLSQAMGVGELGSWGLDTKSGKAWRSLRHDQIFGYSELLPEWTYKMFLDHVLPEDRKDVDEKFGQALAKGVDWNFECRIRRSDGEIRWIWAQGKPRFNDRKEVVQLFGLVQDITERKEKEEILRKLNRTLRALSNSEQAMTHAKDESQYLQEVCDIIVKDCGHAMVWVGYAEDDENKTVRPVANSGFEHGYLETLNITWADTERGRGPTGTAIRTGRMSMCRNMLTDPAFAPWRGEALKRGYASSIVLPLISDDKAFGALTIYSKTPESFSDDEVKLLTELADDLAHGVGTIRLRIAHARAEEELRKSHDELEIRVKERTADLDEAVLDLQKQVEQRLRAEEAFRSASLYSRALIEASLDPLVTISQDGKITDVNRATELATGATRDQLIGTDFSNYFTEPEKARQGYKRVFADGFVTDYPLTIRHRNGQLIDVLYNAAIYKNEAGEIQGVFAAARDITERKLAEERQGVTNLLLELYAKKTSRKDYLDSAIEAIRSWSGCSRVGVRVKDDKGNIPYDSSVGFEKGFLALENTLNLGRDKCLCMRAILQQPVEQDKPLLTAGGSFYSNDSLAFVKSLSPEQAKDYRGNCMKHGFQSIAVVPIRYRDEVVGVIHLADSQKNMVPLAKIQFFETTISPLVGEAIHRFNAEAELEQYRLHLEDLVKNRTEELARSNKDLEQFAYVASHDLQEPLRAVSGFVELLRRSLEKSLDAKTSEYMNFSIDGAKRMQSLINGLLEYSRIGTQGKKPQKVNSKEALDEGLARLQASIQESGAKITADDLPTVYFDDLQLARLFQNLVGNAIKFRGEQTPQIHISAVRQDAGWQFAVRDNGIGIEPQYAERIFMIFQRLHTRKVYPGTGIGLSICKKIIERHGGKIWVESVKEQGSTFYFTVPDIGEAKNEV
jgi:PAS domain S-box-containing protein